MAHSRVLVYGLDWNGDCAAAFSDGTQEDRVPIGNRFWGNLDQLLVLLGRTDVGLFFGTRRHRSEIGLLDVGCY